MSTPVCPVHDEHMQQKTSKAGNTYFRCQHGDYWANAQGDVRKSDRRPQQTRSYAPPAREQNKDEQIFAQVALKCASTVYSGTGDGEGAVNLFKRLYHEIALPVIEGKPIPFAQKKIPPTPKQVMEGDEDINF